MQKALLFFLALIVLLAIAYKPVEGFQNLMGARQTHCNLGTPPEMNSRLSSNQSNLPVAEQGVGNIEPSPAPPSDLPSAPTGFHAKETPNPYRNPTLEPAKYIRLVAVKEDLQAFFGFQVDSLTNKSDPSIQMPLTRARADLSELIDIQSVIERNPGLQSRINNKQLDDMKSNLNYLRKIINDTTLDVVNNSEGFKNYKLKRSSRNKKKSRSRSRSLGGSRNKKKSRSRSRSLGGSRNKKKSRSPSGSRNKKKSRSPSGSRNKKKSRSPSGSRNKKMSRSPSGSRNKKMSRSPSGSRSGSRSKSYSKGRFDNEEPATLKELQAFQIKVVVEIQRLSASGTSDPLILSRISTLTNIKNDVDDVIHKIETKVYTSKTVPIMKSDIEKSLPVLGDQTKPLPTVLKKLNLPPAISSLFPNGMSPKDSEQSVQINNIVKGYMKNLFEGASWGFNFQYDNPNAKHSRGSSRSNIPTGLPGVKAKMHHSGQTNNGCQRKECQYKKKCDGHHGGHHNKQTQGLLGSSTEFRTLREPKAGGLDWKKRSKEIIQQIKKRGLNPLQYGAISQDAIVSNDFSWRGYTRMLCMRLNATTDPGLAVTVGCPPEEWKGWKE